MFNLEGRTALITGAGQGMGAGIARALAAQGAAVIVNDISEERAGAAVAELAEAGAKVACAVFDVTQLKAVESGIAEAGAAFGPIDILVNNAGNAGDHQMNLVQFREQSPDQWQRFLDVNLLGVLNCVRATVNGMCERRWGRIVTISSLGGQIGNPAGISLYGAAKAGAIGFMRHLACEVGPHGVTANTLALGLMNNAGDAKETRGIVDTVPVGRLGSPADVGATVAFLASDEAEWMTAQTIGLNGGMHAN